MLQVLQRIKHCRVLCVPLAPDRRTVGQSGQPCYASLLQGHGAGSGQRVKGSLMAQKGVELLPACLHVHSINALEHVQYSHRSSAKT